jgi:hypothetical protein
MSRRSWKSKRRSKALPALGIAGLSLGRASGASASIGEATANIPSISQSHEIFLGEEEISDVSLATFYLFDKENTGAIGLRFDRRGNACGCGGAGCCACGCAPPVHGTESCRNLTHGCPPGELRTEGSATTAQQTGPWGFLRGPAAKAQARRGTRFRAKRSSST